MRTRIAHVFVVLAVVAGVSNGVTRSALAVDGTPTPRSAGPNSNLVIDTFPVRNTAWPMCWFDAQEYCFEPATVIDENGSEAPVTSTQRLAGVGAFTNCHNNVPSNDYCVFDGSDWIEVGLSGTFSEADLKLTFRWKLRTGKFEPDVMMLGDTQKMVVAGNATDGWTLEIWARPALKAYLNGCHSAQTCSSDTVATSVRYGLEGYARMLGINESWPSVESLELRDALRGTFISTNGMSQSWTFRQHWFYVTAVSPHFLPPVNGAPSQVTPGYVKVFLPEKYFTLGRGYKDLTSVTAKNVRLKVSGEEATPKLTQQDGGILIDTGVTHFSAPNPEFNVLAAGESLVAESPTTAAPVTAAPNTVAPVVAPVRATLKKGSAKALNSIARTTSKQKPKWSTKGQCKISGSRVVALKKTGTCTVTLRVLNSKKKFVVKTTKTFAVK